MPRSRKLNLIFVDEASLAGVASTDYYMPVDAFDIMKTTDPAHDAPATVPFSPLDYEIFGANPALAGVPAEAGSYDVFNGALLEFYDAYNVELYSWLNPNVDITSMPSDDLFVASSQATDAVLALGNASLAADAFLSDGWNDLLGYFGIFSM